MFVYDRDDDDREEIYTQSYEKEKENILAVFQEESVDFLFDKFRWRFIVVAIGRTIQVHKLGNSSYGRKVET